MMPADANQNQFNKKIKIKIKNSVPIYENNKYYEDFSDQIIRFRNHIAYDEFVFYK